MQPILPTTPFGRRPMSLALIKIENEVKDRPPGGEVDKWKTFDDICAAKDILGLSDRTLCVLRAIMSFWIEARLPAEGSAIVFPSNNALARRANGMSEPTLRRHLGILVRLGFIQRRDSPNGKRYARKGEGGEIEAAFGFDLALIAARAEEFGRLAAEARAAARRLRALRERISLARRDIDKMIAAGIYEDVPGDWRRFADDFEGLNAPLSRRAAEDQLAPLAEALAALAAKVRKALDHHIESIQIDGNADQNERHIHNSTQTPSLDLELGHQMAQGPDVEPHQASSSPPSGGQGGRSYPLGMVLQACPDMIDHSDYGEIRSWREFVAVAEKVRPWMGVSPSAWEDACDVLGREDAAATLAAILQRGEAIKSAGGYLRDLTAKARAGAFSLGPVLMALINSHLRRTQGKRA